MPWPYLIPAMLMVGGCWLMIAGLIGRRVNDHPHCRRCRFDLSGIAAASVSIAGQSRCPECGQDISIPGAIKIGLRKRRRGLLSAGLALIVLMLTLAGGAVWLATKGGAVYAKLPTNTLLWLVPYLDSNQLGIAGKELKSRAVQGSMSASQWQNLATATLARQRNRSRPWSASLGEVFELGYEKQAISKAQFDEYLQHSVIMELHSRPLVGVGDPIPLEVKMDIRLGWTGNLRMRTKLTDVIVGDTRIDGERFGYELTPDTRTFGMSFLDTTVRLSPESVDLKPAGLGRGPGIWKESLVPAKTGPTTVQTVWAVAIDPVSGQRATSGLSRMLTPPPRPGPRRDTDEAIIKRFRQQSLGDPWFMPSSSWTPFGRNKTGDKAGGAVFMVRAERPIVVTEHTPEPLWMREPADAASAIKGMTAQRFTSAGGNALNTYDSLSITSGGGAAVASKLYEVVDGDEELLGTIALESVNPAAGRTVAITSASLGLDTARIDRARRTFVLRPDVGVAKTLIGTERVLGVPVWFVDVQSSSANGGTWIPGTSAALTDPSTAGTDESTRDEPKQK